MAAIERLVELAPHRFVDFDDPAGAEELARVEVLLTGWGCPRIDEPVLDHAPKLAAILHAAGSVKGHISAACWARGIAVSTAADANGIPVAEYSVAMILLAGKRVFTLATRYRRRRSRADLLAEAPSVGNYRRRVGIVGASRIGRRVIELLRPYDLQVVLSDPYVDQPSADRLGVELADLDELLAGCDVVSLHAPSTAETRHLIDRRRLALLRDSATLINTARGALVDQQALVDELETGRITAVIDVTDPEVPPPASPLYTLPNVMLTPHIAGSVGNELFRLGESAAAELARYVRGEPLRFPVSIHELNRMA